MYVDKIRKQSIILLAYSLIALFIAPISLAADFEREKIQTVSYEHVLNWALGLIIVLSLFFACVWVMRKMGGFTIPPKEGMKIISGLSLGSREKLLLVQVGDKQLVLAVMPGKIDKILVLEGDERLLEKGAEKKPKSDFLHHLAQPMKGSVDE